MKERGPEITMHRIYQKNFFLDHFHPSMDRKMAQKWCDQLSQLNPLFSSKNSSLDFLDSLDPFFSFFSLPFEKNKEQDPEKRNFSLEELIFYPGTFSPWHSGHEACILGVRQRKEEKEKKPILILPDLNPWKKERSSFWAKDLCAIIDFIRDNPNENLFLYPGFLCLEKSNPTASWLPELRVSKKYLLLGDDTFLQIHRWQNSLDLLSSLRGLYICPRQRKDKILSNHCAYLREKCGGNSTPEFYFLDHHAYEGVSSTKFRQMREEG